MTWEQKFAALNALAPAELKMRKPGDWYVSQPVETKERVDSGVLVGRYGNGRTPIEAVEDHWNRLTNEKPLAYLVVGAFGSSRKHVLWNGFMWQEMSQ